MVQVSPPIPDAFLRPQQPTGQVQVAPFFFRTPPDADLHRFMKNRDRLQYHRSPERAICGQYQCITARPVSVSPNTLARDVRQAKLVEGRLSSPSARFSRTSQRYPACS